SGWREADNIKAALSLLGVPERRSVEEIFAPVQPSDNSTSSISVARPRAVADHLSERMRGDGGDRAPAVAAPQLQHGPHDVC
ncbi:unnamed protein product, partial [Amoebophrya sp. A120]